jgi:hypothetical protein
MVTLASIYLRFYIEVGVGIGKNVPTPTPPKNSFRLRLHNPGCSCVKHTP